MVEVPEGLSSEVGVGKDGGPFSPTTSLITSLEARIASLETQVAAQQHQLEAKDLQISELHVLLQQAQGALPSPRERSWWKWWGRS